MVVDLAHMRLRLKIRQEELAAELRAAKESTRPIELDQTSVGRLSRMDAIQVQAMAKAREKARRLEFEQIEVVLERMDRGEYGNCVVCEEEIASDRLASNPAVLTCISCARGGSR